MAQTGTIRGFVYNEDTGEPVIFTNVYLEGTSIGAATDVNGYYAITKIPSGEYNLMVTFLGFDTLKQILTVEANKIITKKLFLKKSSISLKMFNVSAEKQEAKTEVKMSVVKITPKEIKQIPTIGGEADIAQYLQVLPGVIFTGDQGGQLYIRGGSPIQNKVLLDGMIIYNPFHSIGLFSVFDTDIMRNADIYTGGFNAEYGGRISSVMDITTRDGNKKRYAGKVGLSTFGVKLLAEGPIFKAKEQGGSSSSFIFSAKHSYLDYTSKSTYKYKFDENGKLVPNPEGLPFGYTDLYGKMSFSGESGSKFNIFGFNFRDWVNWQLISDLSWNTWGLGGNFVLVPGNTPILVEGNFAYSQYDITLKESDLDPRFSAIDGFNLGFDFTYFIGDNEVKYGVEVLGFATDYEFFNALGQKNGDKQNTTELSGYLKYKWNFGKLILEPSFRLQYYASLNDYSPEPRFGFKYNVSDNFRVKLAAGMYSQNLISANSDRDVVNLFYGFLSGPDDLQDSISSKNGNIKERTHALQKANHAIVGFEVDLGRRINVNVEGYYKQFTQLTNLNRNKIFEDTPDNSNRPDVFKEDFIIETGDAYGVDFVLKYDYKQLYVWAVYSLGVVNRWDGIVEYHPIFDRRHNMNFLATYIFGKDHHWEASVRWNLGSGFPFRPTAGFYEKITFSEIGTPYETENGELGFSYGEINSKRLPYYHRLDATVKRKFYLSENSIIEANIGVTNAYNRQNIFFIDRFKNKRVDQLPILPSVGLNWRF